MDRKRQRELQRLRRRVAQCRPGEAASAAPAPLPFDPLAHYDPEKIGREQEEELLAMGVEPERARAGEPLTEVEEIELIGRLAERIGREREAAERGG